MVISEAIVSSVILDYIMYCKGLSTTLIHQLLPQHPSIWNHIRKCVILDRVVYSVKCLAKRSSSSRINKETHINTQDTVDTFCFLITTPSAWVKKWKCSDDTTLHCSLLWCWQRWHRAQLSPECSGNHVSITLVSLSSDSGWMFHTYQQNVGHFRMSSPDCMMLQGPPLID